ncbi:MAG: acetyl-CoA C-acyltransferase [Actinobacteria bacterium]|nr:acetyl-CoA C-acyltransferase [Actinomycetota bacterium]
MSPREAVIVDAVRTPIGRRNGSLATFHPNDLLAVPLKALIERTGVDPGMIDDVVGGCVSQVGEQSTNTTRNGWIAAGLPWHVPATTVDRQCGSSQQAVHFAAQGVMAGSYDIAIACGVEVMSRVPLASNARGGDGPFSQGFMAAVDGKLLTQFECSQILADKFGITREDMDEFSLQSHQRAAVATDAGKFANEIVPVKLPDGREMTADEGIRRDTSLERLAALPSAWNETTPGITAGNASQVSDGAAAMLIADRETAERLGLPIRARFVHLSVGGDDAVNVLSAPNPVTRRMLERTGMKIDEFDAVECNEAFAAIALMWAKEFQPESERYNGWGGAIAIGHPLGASGVRIMTTLLNRLEDGGGRYGFQTMCEGGGMANATVIERLS